MPCYTYKKRMVFASHADQHSVQIPHARIIIRCDQIVQNMEYPPRMINYINGKITSYEQ